MPKPCAYHLSKTERPAGQPACGRGTRATSGISVPAERLAMEEDRCGHCARTTAGKRAIDLSVLKAEILLAKSKGINWVNAQIRRGNTTIATVAAKEQLEAELKPLIDEDLTALFGEPFLKP